MKFKEYWEWLENECGIDVRYYDKVSIEMVESKFIIDNNERKRGSEIT